MYSSSCCARWLVALALLASGDAPAAVIVWNATNNISGNTNWSAGANWSGGTPGSGNDVKFYDPGATGNAVGNINNVVDNNTTVASLQYGNTNGSHTTLIPAGRTLALSGSGGLSAGTGTDNGAGQMLNATITGAGGALVVNNTSASINVYQGSGTAGSQRATLDLSGLDALTATVSSVQIGVQGVTKPTGTLLLARTNTVTASGGTGLLIGQASADGTGTGNYLYLGQTNFLRTGTISVGRGKGGALNWLGFNPAFTNANPSIRIRAVNGTSRVGTWEIGNSVTSSGQNDSVGVCDFSGGTVDALADTMIVGQGQPASNGSRKGEGTLTFSAGTVDVNTLDVGHQVAANTSYGVGTVNVLGSGTLVVNTRLDLGEGSSASTKATLNIFGGTVRANMITNGASPNTVLALSSGTLILSNATALNLSALRVTNSALRFPISLATTNFMVTSLACGGPSNTIHISSLPAVLGYPVTFRVIKYGSLGGTLNFALGSLPAAAPAYAGFISNNTAAGAVDLVLTAGPALAQLRWTGATDGNWNTSTTNWQDLAGQPALFPDGAHVRFDDSASGSTSVSIVGTRIAGSMTMSNNALAYTFSGSGALGGSGSLTKQGGGSLTLANTGNNTFSGAITNSGGTLQFGNGGSGGPPGTGPIVNNASLIFNRSASFAVSNGVAGSGSLTKSGSGTMTLEGANSYSGTTMLSAGKLILNGRITGGGTLTAAAGTTLAGEGTNSGPIIVGGVLLPGDAAEPGVFTSGALTLNPGATMQFDLGGFTYAGSSGYGLSPVNDLLQVNGALNNNSITVNLLEPPQIGKAYQLIAFTGARSGVLNPAVTITGGSGYAAALDYSVAGQVRLTFTNGPMTSIPLTYPEGPGPATVGFGPDGKLVYTYEPNGDRIPDFSRCGYGGGGVTIPTNIPIRQTVSPIGGDNRANIQAAIDAVEALAPDVNGFRGVVFLQAGVYPMTGTLRVEKSGIVIRGAGSGTNGTILRRTDNVSDDLILVEPTTTSGRSEVSGTRKYIQNAYVPVGATWVTVDNTSGLAVGDTIAIRRPQSTPSEWVTIMGMQPSEDGGTGDWQNNDATVVYDRVITEIEGNRIRFDTPIITPIEKQWAPVSYLYKYTWPGRLEQVGIEDIRGESAVGPDANGNYVGDLFMFNQVINGWIRRCHNEKMSGHCIKVNSSKWVTIEDIVSYHPYQASHSGAATQIYTGDSMDQVLFHRITAYASGFEFSAGNSCAGPVVYCESQVPQGIASSGPHGTWNNGFLWDVLEMDHSIGVQIQQKGWNGADHLAWNVETKSSLNFERPPTVHLWIQGCQGPSYPSSPRSSSVAYGARNPEVLSWGTRLEPASLYRTQLAERVGAQQALAVLGRPDGANHLVLTALPETDTVVAGQSKPFTVQMTVSPDYPGSTVTFSAVGLPTGASASFNPPTRNSDGLVTVTINTTNSTPEGEYTIKIVGTGTFPRFQGGNQTLAHPVFVRLLVTGTDTDGDGIPDSWMNSFFGHPTGQAGDLSLAADDYDNDGMSNVNEFLAGTNPTNSASSLRLVSVAAEGANERVTWWAVGGKSYCVQSTTNLAGLGSFSDISPQIQAPAGAGELTTNYLHMGAANAPTRFYRVRLLP